jgi:hypothetical protein
MVSTGISQKQRGNVRERRGPAAATAGMQDERDDHNSATAPVPQSPESRMNRIARRAHEIYQARGGEHGKALDDWLRAEREVDAEIEASPGADD